MHFLCTSLARFVHAFSFPLVLHTSPASALIDFVSDISDLHLESMLSIQRLALARSSFGLMRTSLQIHLSANFRLDSFGISLSFVMSCALVSMVQKLDCQTGLTCRDSPLLHALLFTAERLD